MKDRRKLRQTVKTLPEPEGHVHIVDNCSDVESLGLRKNGPYLEQAI
jgi:hypothetical protein